ncbi:MAG TPA: serine hydrolase domain-containing protein [Acidimicrobiia bacterium]|nr:serine hydrolase domain-containing protein [Acidimicrobiia bacterium]
MRVVDVLEAGIADGTQIGAQIYVSEGGEERLNAALGESKRGTAMTTDSMMIWFSMTKAITSVAVAQQWERGALDVDDAVVAHIPEFTGKDGVTIRHLLTHTAGLRFADGFLEGAPWSETPAENIARICAAELEYEPGSRAGYHPASGMAVLGEIVARASGTRFDEYVRAEIFEPIGATDCWIGMPADRFAAYGDRIGVMHNTEGTEIKPLKIVDDAPAVEKYLPGGNGRGPMRQLAKVYESLLGFGPQLLDPVTVAAISARHRTQLVDETFGIVLDWGLGFAIDSWHMGRHCSRRAFGHGGHLSSVAFCDPEHGVVAATVCNGMPGRDRHSARFDAISSAIYVDLGIAKPSDDGRTKEFPKAAF